MLTRRASSHASSLRKFALTSWPVAMRRTGRPAALSALERERAQVRLGAATTTWAGAAPASTLSLTSDATRANSSFQLATSSSPMPSTGSGAQGTS